MTDEQGITLARLMRDFNARGARLEVEPFDLPPNYVQATLLDRSGQPCFTAGIDDDGRASS